MSSISIPKASDIVVQFSLMETVPGEENPRVLDLTPYAGISVYLYHKDTTVVLKKYSLNASSGFDPLTITDAKNGRIQIYVPRSITKIARTSVLYAEIKVRKDDTNAEGGKFYSIATEIRVDLMKDTVAPNEDTP